MRIFSLGTKNIHYYNKKLCISGFFCRSNGMENFHFELGFVRISFSSSERNMNGRNLNLTLTWGKLNS